jgi:predicted histidine transporter YuiF (NhaC family)
MLLEADNISSTDNILTSISTWILLAGYIVFPATFNKLQRNIADLENHNSNAELKNALATVRHTPMLVTGSLFCVVGLLRCVFMWFKHRKNYI